MRSPLVSPRSGKYTLSRFVSWTSRRPMRMRTSLASLDLNQLEIPHRGDGAAWGRAHDPSAGSPHITPRRLANRPFRRCGSIQARGGPRHLRRLEAPWLVVTIPSHGEVAEWLKAAP